MKKVTQNAILAFDRNEEFRSGNTKVSIINGETYLFLFDNPIAKKTPSGLFIQNCGWFSNTTKERLNAISGVSISQSNFEWYLNGEKWDGKWTKVN